LHLVMSEGIGCFCVACEKSGAGCEGCLVQEECTTVYSTLFEEVLAKLNG